MRKDIELFKGVNAEVRLEDNDKDGDADLTFYVEGVEVFTIQASTLAGNVKAEFKRVVKKVKKAVKK